MVSNTSRVDGLRDCDESAPRCFLDCLAALVMSAFIAAAPAPAQMCSNWQQITVSMRDGTRMAFDSRRHVTVLFGGRAPFGEIALGDTVEWDGQTWTWRTSSGPPPRAFHAMAYDSQRNVTVLFGGRQAPASSLHDTWEWDGQTWLLRSQAGPSARSAHSMAYDSARGVVVLFGGRSPTGVYFGDTWEWDGQQWSQRATTGPAGRIPAGMAYDSARGVTVMFGGSAGTLVYDDTWEWDGSAWQFRPLFTPGLFSGSAMAFDSSRDVCVLHGGFGAASDETWEYDGTQWTQAMSSGVSRQYHGMAFDSNRNVSVAFGGGSSNDGATMEWNGTAWLAADARPSEGGPLAYHAGIAKTMMFPGSSAAWLWDGERWTRSGPLPFSINSGPALAFDDLRNVLVLAGAHTGGGGYQTWEFDGVTWSQRSLSGPAEPRYMTFDSARGVCVLYNGSTWEWNGKTWTQRFPSTSPQALSYVTIAYDPIRARTVMAGPTSGGVLQTWEWDGDNWNLRSESNADGILFSIAFDPTRAQVIRMSGSDSAPNYVARTHGWNGSAWRELAVPPLVHPSGLALAFDASRSTLVGVDQLMGMPFELRPHPAAAGDITCDGVVNVSDLLAVINQWGPCPAPPQMCPADNVLNLSHI